MSDVAQKTVYSMRKELFNKLMKLPLQFYDAHSTGDILSKMSNDLDTIALTLQQSITQIITSITHLIGFLIMMITISYKLTIIAVLTLPVYSLLMVLIIKYSQKFFTAQQKPWNTPWTCRRNVHRAYYCKNLQQRKRFN